MEHSALAFEGRISAVATREGLATPLLYTAGTNCLRLEITASDRPNPVDLLDLSSGQMKLLFPHNRSFMRLNALSENSGSQSPGFPAMAPGVGAQQPSLATPPSIGATNLQGIPASPAMPPMPAAGGSPPMPRVPPMMMEKVEFSATGEKTNLLGLACEKYEVKQRGETMEIWATAQLFPFQLYVQNQPHRLGSKMIEERWGGVLTGKKLFPLLATLKLDDGAERYRFEVQKIQPEKMTGDDAKLFLPPPGYVEIQPLPF